jgi:hypothetical protein
LNPSALLAGLLLTSGMACLAPKLKADFEADLRRWVGRPTSEFIRAKGNPAEIKPRPEGGRIYVFMTHTQGTNYRDTANFANADGTLGGAAMAMGGPLRCRLILETDAADTILITRWEGNDCW